MQEQIGWLHGEPILLGWVNLLVANLQTDP
jgi:hypothetical protein